MGQFNRIFLILLSSIAIILPFVRSSWAEKITYGNGLFVAVGNRTLGNSSEGFIFTSQDGVNWTRK